MGFEVCNMTREERGRRDFWVACNEHILGVHLCTKGQEMGAELCA